MTTPFKLNVKRHFAGWIGQPDSIDYLDRMISAKAIDPNFPLQPIFFNGHAGLGKSMLMDKVADAMGALHSPFKKVTLSSAVSLPDLQQIWGNLIEGQQVCIIVDECDGISRNKRVGNLLKMILETQKSIKEVPLASGAHITANPFQHLWMFASNEEPKDSALFGPCSRTKTLTLLPYNEAEKREMIEFMADKQGFKVHKDAIEYLSGRVFPNGRSISELVENDLASVAVLNGGNAISLEAAKYIVAKTKRYPGGLQSIDLITLKALQTQERGLQVGEIAMRCGGEASTTTAIRLRLLSGAGYVVTRSGLKILTQAGKDYLTEIVKMQDLAKAAKKAAATRAKAKVKDEGAKEEAKESIPEASAAK